MAECEKPVDITQFSELVCTAEHGEGLFTTVWDNLV